MASLFPSSSSSTFASSANSITAPPPYATESVVSYESMQTMPLMKLLSLLLQPSQCDDKIDMLVDTLVNGEATATDVDPNRSVRMILLDHLVQLRDERRQMQANIETYVKVLQQVNEDEKEAKKMRDFYEKNKSAFEGGVGGSTEPQIPLGSGGNPEPVAPSSVESSKDPPGSPKKGSSSSSAVPQSTKDLKDLSKEEILQMLEKVMLKKQKEESSGASTSSKKRRRRHHSSSSNSSTSSRSSYSSNDSRKRKRSSKSRSHRRSRDNKKRSRERSAYPVHAKTTTAPTVSSNAYYDFYTQPPPPGVAPNFSVPPPSMYPPHYTPPVWPGMATAAPPAPSIGPPPPPFGKPPGRKGPLDFEGTAQKLPPAPPAGTKLTDLRSMYAKCAKEEKWAKFLESSLKNRPGEEELALVFNELIVNDSLIADHNGCYVIKTLFEVGNAEQRSQITQRLKMQFKNVAATVYGSDFILTVVEKLGEPAAVELVPEMRTIVVVTSKNQHGSKVVEKFIDLLPSDQIKFFADEIWEGGIFNLSRHPTANRIVDAVLRKFDYEHKSKLLKDLLMFAEQMITDQNATNVVRAALETSPAEIKRQIVKICTDDFVNLAQHNWAHQTVQLCISVASREEITTILNSLLSNYSSNSIDKFPLMDLMLDKFGCTVVIHLLDRLEETDPLENTRMMNFIQPHLPYLEKVPRCKRIVAKYYKHCMENYPPQNVGLNRVPTRQPLIQQYFP